MARDAKKYGEYSASASSPGPYGLYGCPDFATRPLDLVAWTQITLNPLNDIEKKLVTQEVMQLKSCNPSVSLERVSGQLCIRGPWQLIAETKSKLEKLVADHRIKQSPKPPENSPGLLHRHSFSIKRQNSGNSLSTRRNPVKVTQLVQITGRVKPNSAPATGNVTSSEPGPGSSDTKVDPRSLRRSEELGEANLVARRQSSVVSSTSKSDIPKRNHKLCDNCCDSAQRTAVATSANPLLQCGEMTKNNLQLTLRGFENDTQCDGTIKITYTIPDGTQSKDHPNPGRPFTGTCRHAYLPDNPEGRVVLQLLECAFKEGLIFKVTRSQSSDEEDSIEWGIIPHKENLHEYPDANYLKKVKSQLTALGIVESNFERPDSSRNHGNRDENSNGKQHRSGGEQRKKSSAKEQTDEAVTRPSSSETTATRKRVPRRPNCPFSRDSSMSWCNEASPVTSTDMFPSVVDVTNNLGSVGFRPGRYASLDSRRFVQSASSTALSSQCLRSPFRPTMPQLQTRPRSSSYGPASKSYL